MAANPRKRLDSNQRIWEEGFEALTRFKAREGHCHVSRFHFEGDYWLGPWVSTQRYKRERMAVERRKRLDAIGFIWDWRDYRWEKGFAALVSFKAREGHCRAPSSLIESDYKLGWWVVSQRRKKDGMIAERKRRLNRIGFVWDARK
jgi:hypothetical protein